MKRIIPLLSAAMMFFCASTAVTGADQLKLTEKQQQSRLKHFKPAFTKQLDPSLPDREFLVAVASDTWGYFRDVVDQYTGLPLDNVMVFSTYTKVNSYTTTTNIGLYLMCVVSAYDLGFIDKTEASRRIKAVLSTLKRLKSYEGQFFNYYETITLENNGKFVSTVDNGWLAAGLIVTKRAFSGGLIYDCDTLVNQLKLHRLYNKQIGQFHLGYDAHRHEFSKYHYGNLCTEPRVASYIAIARGEVPESHWFKLNRTLPQDWTWQNQKPKGSKRKYKGNDVFQGYYVYKDYKYVPSWGGSMFEFLMPRLVLKEQEIAKDSLALNNSTVVDAQIYYALEEMKYPVWGISPCSVPGDPWGYSEYGVKFLGSKGYEDKGVITPHATFLALDIAPGKALKNLRELLKFKDMYGEYGFYDAVNVKNGKVSTKYLCLDQAMTLISLNNYLNNNAIRERFHKEPKMKAAEKLLAEEKFF